MNTKQLQNALIATQFLGSTIQPLKPTFPKFERQYNESHKLAYYLVSMLSIDIHACFDHLISDIKVLPNLNLDSFNKVAGEDFDYIFNTAKKKNKTDHMNADYEYLTDFLDNLTSKSLSGFQKQSDVALEPILRCIYSIYMFKEANVYQAASQGRTTLKEWDDFFDGKVDMLKSIFLKRFKIVSNKPNFDFEKHNKFFYKLVRSTYSEFRKSIGI